jgi:two-component system chemotaxis sensor kinase CheA
MVEEEAPVDSFEAPSPEEVELIRLVGDSFTETAVTVAPVVPLPKAQTAATAAASTEESIRVSLARLEKLINSVGELVILQTVLREQSFGANPHLLRKTVHQMGKVTKEVQDISMSLRMVPLKQTFQKMQRIVRDTSNMLGKRVHLSTSGDDTELDKTVLENISDPLVHLIRNACDHGVESPEARVAKGKPESGTVRLNAYHQSGKLVIEVKDDGGGIDGQKLTAKAIEKGILKPGTALPEQEAIHLIFHPGFSTKAQVTEVSGRGVGMDVVKTNIEALQGEVQVETELGKGTTFKVVLPLTLAIIDGMVVQNEGCRFVVPLSHVHETLKPAESDVKQTTGLGEVLLLRGENLPLYRLNVLLGHKKGAQKAAHEQIAMVVRYAGHPFAVLVDDILGQQQVVIKEVGQEIQNLKWMSGSAILGDGKPAIIIEMNELVKPAKRGVA